MACDSNCGMCITGDQWVIILDTVNYPNSADYGAHIIVSGQIQKAWSNFDADTSCLICIMEGSNCLASSEVSIILPGSIVDFSLPIDMPNHDITINITVKSKGVLGFSYGCSDTKSFTIKVNKYFDCVGGVCIQSFIPRSTSYSSSDACVASGCKSTPKTYTDYTCIANVCTSVETGTGYPNLKACTDTGCKAPGGGVGVPCKTGETNLYGILQKCYPQNDVYIGLAGVALLFMMMQKK